MTSRRTAGVNVKLLVILVVGTAVLAAGAIGGYKLRKRHIASKALAAGQAAVKAQDWPEACTQLKVYLSKYPDDEEVLAQYGEANLKVRPPAPENTLAAITAYRRLLRFRPGDADASRKLMLLYRQTGEMNEVAYVARQRLSQDPQDTYATLALAGALIGLEKGDEAEQILLPLVKAHPEEVDAFILLNRIATGDRSSTALDEAQAWLDQAVEKNPKSAKALVFRSAFLQLERGDAKAAQKDLELANSLNPQDPTALLMLFELWLRQGRLGQAEAQLKAIRAIPAADLGKYEISEEDLKLAEMNASARLALRRGLKDGLRVVADRAMAELVGYRRTLFLPSAIELYLGAGDTDKAKSALGEYEKAVSSLMARDPTLADRLATARAAVTLSESGANPFDVIQKLKDVTIRDPRNAWAWRLLAAAYERAGEASRGLEALERYLQQVPSDADVSRLVAKAYLTVDPKRALQYALQAEHLNPGDPEVRLMRIEAQLELARQSPKEIGDPKARLDELQNLYETNSHSARVMILLGRLAAAGGRIDEAIDWLTKACTDSDNPLLGGMQLVKYAKLFKRYDAAAVGAHKTIEARPEMAVPRILLADVLEASGKKNEARKVLEEAAASLKGNELLVVQVALAQFIFMNDQREDGIQRLKQLAMAHPENIQLRMGLLHIPEVRSDPAQAQVIIDEIKAIEGQQAMVWPTEQAKLLMAADDWEKHQKQIEDLLTQAVKNDPGSTEAALLLGEYFERIGDQPRGETSYRRCLDQTGNVQIAQRLVTLLQGQGRYDDAQAILSRVPPWLAAVVMPQRLNLAIGSGNYSQAIEELRGMVEAQPQNADSRVLLARLIYEHEKDAAGAMKLLDEAEAIQPGLLTAAAARAGVFRGEGKPEEAIRLLDAQVNKRNDFDAYRTRAEYYANAGESALAEKDLVHLTTLKDAGIRGFVALGEFYRSANRMDDAIAAWSKGLEKDPGNGALKRLIALSLLDMEDPAKYQEGEGMLGDLIASFPNDPALLMAKAHLIATKGTPEARAQATATCEHVLQVAPYRVEPYFELFDIARASNDMGKARDVITRAVGAHPRNAELLAIQAKFEAIRGNTTSAAQLARRVLDLDKDNVAALQLLAELSLSFGDLDTAGQMADEVIARDPKNESAWLTRASVLGTEGKWDEAIAALEKRRATEEGAKSVRLLLALAEMYGRKSDFAAARQRLDQAAVLAPDDIAVFQANLQWLAAQQKYDDVLRQVTERISAGSAGDPNVLLFTGASVLATAGEPNYLTEARHLLEKLTQAVPKHVDGLLLLAQVCYALHDLPAAEQAYRKVLEIEPYHGKALNDLAWLLGVEDKKVEEALELVEKGVLRYPEDAHLADTKGALLLVAGREAEAQKELERCLKLTEQMPSTRASALFTLARVHIKLGAADLARQRLAEAMELDERYHVLSPERKAEIQELLNSLGKSGSTG